MHIIHTIIYARKISRFPYICFLSSSFLQSINAKQWKTRPAIINIFTINQSTGIIACIKEIKTSSHVTIQGSWEDDDYAVFPYWRKATSRWPGQLGSCVAGHIWWYEITSTRVILYFLTIKAHRRVVSVPYSGSYASNRKYQVFMYLIMRW